MNTDKEKLLEKLQKLFALSRSDNQNEAELALAKANKLMEEHQIGMSEVDLFEDGGSVTEDEFVVDGVKSYGIHVFNLAISCAKFYNAEVLRIHRRYKSKGVTLRFIGTPTDIAAATATFYYLLNSWKNISNFDLKKSNYRGHAKIFKNSHFYGFSIAILRRINDLLNSRNDKVLAVTGRDLIVVKNAAIEDYLKNTKIKENGKHKMNNFSREAFDAGTISGQNIPLSGAIGHSNLMIGKV